jgi:hypothetical protein
MYSLYIILKSCVCFQTGICMYVYVYVWNRLCGLVVRVPGYRARGPGSIPDPTRFFWEIVGLERGPLSLVSTIEGLLERKSSGSGLESREHGRRDPSRWPRGTLYPQKLSLTSPTSGSRSVGIVRSRTKATEFPFGCASLRHYVASRKVGGSRPAEVNFSIYVILPASLDPGVYSVSNRNEYQTEKSNVWGE